MLTLELEKLTFRDYLDSLTGFEQPGSTANRKLLGRPFRDGRITLTYAEPGLAVMRCEIRLGADMMLLKAAAPDAGGLLDVQYYFGYSVLGVNDSLATIVQAGYTGRAAGVQRIVTYFSNAAELLMTYPPQSAKSSVLVQAGAWWLATHFPALAAYCRQSPLQTIFTVPAAAVPDFDRFLSLLDAPMPAGDTRSRAAVKSFLQRCHSLMAPGAQPPPVKAKEASGINEQLNELIAGVLANIDKPLPTLGQMSKISGIKVHTLRAKFSRQYGESVTDYFMKLQMAWAENELRRRGGSVKSVGYQIGYQNLSHFSAAFRKYRGVLPGSIHVLQGQGTK